MPLRRRPFGPIPGETLSGRLGISLDPSSIARSLHPKWVQPMRDELIVGIAVKQQDPLLQIPKFILFPPPDPSSVPPGMEHQYLEAIDAHRERITGIIEKNKEPFIPFTYFQIDDNLVQFGSPLQLKQYDAIPVYVSKVGEASSARLVFAYQSKSQDCWRRFAGEALGIYWKGPSEHLQNFDWRIQKVLDSVYAHRPHYDMRRADGRHMALEDLSISSPSWDTYAECMDLITASESRIQGSMIYAEPPYQIGDPNAKPTHLIDYWWSGKVDDPYGCHVNLIARSGRYLYSIALTDDGLFPKFIQILATDDGINEVGAPRHCAPLPDSLRWVLTPILEHDGLQHVANTRNIDVEGTVMGGGGRVRIRGIHRSRDSPFFELNNGLEELCRLLRCECYEAVDKKLRHIMDSGKLLPLSSKEHEESPMDDIKEEVEARHRSLMEAFHLFEIQHDQQDAINRLKSSFSITDRDIALFKRYLSLVNYWNEQYAGPMDADLQFHRQLLARRLRRVAIQDVRDQHETTLKVPA